MPMIKDPKLTLDTIHAIRSDLTVYNFATTQKDKTTVIDSVTDLLERVEVLALGAQGECEQFTELIKLSKVVEVVISQLPGKSRSRIKCTTANVTVHGSERDLRILVKEMLNNALAYSIEDVHLSIHNTGSHAVLRLEDFGDGIPEHIQASIGEPFIASESGQSGHGLGFALMWSITQSHQGGLTLVTDSGEGTTLLFSFDLV